MATEERVERFRDWLRAHALPVTPQRLAIAEVVLRAGQTISAEEIASALSDRGTRVGVATVYRTLDVLVASGLAVERDFAEGFRRFEAVNTTAAPVHLLCTTCGHGEEQANAALDALAHRVADASEFVPDRHRLLIYGTCAECRERASQSVTDGATQPSKSTVAPLVHLEHVT